MSAGAEAIRWAPRVSRLAIRRLYEADASGVVDEELIDEVAFAFLARCQSIRTATAAYHGYAACPLCSRVIEHRHRGDEVLRCDSCSWETTWLEYRRTYQRKYLITGNPDGAFVEYPRRLRAARSPQQRMIAVDWLVYQIHSWTPDGDGPRLGRPTATALIEGSETKIIAFLDELAAAPGATSQSRSAHERWRDTLWLQSER